MWTDAGADPARCAGSGSPGEPARPLADGYPEGRALCGVCLRFVKLDEDSTLTEHETADPDETESEAVHRQEWFNTYGW